MAIQDTVNGIAQFPQSFETLISLLMCSTNSAFLSAIIKEILPLQAIMAGRTPLQAMGLAWAGISRLLLNLVIPDTPVDPAVVHSSGYDRMKREESDLNIQVALHQQLEALLTGYEDNDFIRYLTPRLLHIRSDLATSPIVPNRSDVARLHLFWSEVLQFQASVLSPSKIDGLINAIVRGDEDADLREQVTQKSLEGFCQRLDTVYYEFVDISSLLNLAVLYMRFGLRILSESTTMSRTKSPSADMVMTLLSFPSVNSADRLIVDFQKVAPSGTTAFRHVLLTLGALSLEKAIGLQNDYRKQSIHMAYEQAMGLWLIDQAKEKQHQEEESTLYRKVDYNVATDAEIEEEEFLAMFPTFEDALENLANEATSIHSQRTRPSLLVQSEDMSTLLRIHYDLTGFPLDLTTRSASDIFAEMRSKVIKDLLTESPDSLPETLDEVGIPFQFNLLQDNILALDIKQSPTTPSYNFYSDPNYSELKKAAVIVDALRRRLHAISQEWPDQMVVQHLIERCDTILNIGSKIPIAKAIAMLEQLLIQSEDWQMYSNRENSIKVHQEEIVRLMVDWRRLELACWQSLLDSQAKTFTGELSEWWFRLYDAVIRGSLSAVEEAASGGSQNLDQYLANLIPLLDDFVASSPLGQFESRMQLIQSFERYLEFIAPSRPTSHASALQRVARVLNASHRYYDLFTDPLRKRLTDEKSLLEKEIKNFIKLASWKDINVQALKQSAQRTHRQLYKIMRKFRDVLRQPISGQLQPSLAGDAENRPLSFDKVSDATMDLSFPLIPVVSSTERLDIPQHLVNLEKTFDKYMSLIKKRVQPFISSYSAHSVDEAAVEIITTSKALASLAIPSGESTERREKYRKSLLVRKRKAWADLLKELKHAGLASSLKPEILRQNTNQQWLREQLPLPGGPVYDIEVKKGDTYFVKLCGCMPSLRSSLPAHHSDLTTRELQRGHMFLESGFAMAVDLRSRSVY
jgi:midasin